MLFTPLSALILATVSSFASVKAQNATARAVLSFNGMGVGPGNVSMPKYVPVTGGPANAATVKSFFADASSIPHSSSGWGPYSSGASYPLTYNTNNGPGSYVMNMNVPIDVIYFHNNDLPASLPTLVNKFLGTLPNAGTRKSSEVPNGIASTNWFNVLRNYYNTGYLPWGSTTPQYINNIYFRRSDSFHCSWGWRDKPANSGAKTNLNGLDVQNILMTVTNDKTNYPNGILDDKAIYIIVLSPSIVESIDGTNNLGQRYCAYHSTFQNRWGGSAAQIWYKYAVVQAPSPGSKCVAKQGTANDDASDHAIFFIAHEIAETLTDPSPVSQWTPGAWADRAGLEMADKCEEAIPLLTDSAGKFYNTIIDGTKMMLPALWDIRYQKCSMGKSYGFYIVLDDGQGIRFAVTSAAQGGQLRLQNINYSASQQWQFSDGTTGTTNNALITNAAAGCFGAPTNDWAPVTQQACSSSNDLQKWIFYTSTQTIQNRAGSVHSNNGGNNGGMGLTASGNWAGATLTLQWTGRANQKFVLVPAW